MQISTRKVTGIGIIDIQGKISADDGALEIQHEVERLVKTDRMDRIIFNLKKVPSIDASGIGEILYAMKLLRDRNGRLMLLSPCKKVLNELLLFRLNKFIEWYFDEDEAIEHMLGAS